MSLREVRLRRRAVRSGRRRGSCPVHGLTAMRAVGCSVGNRLVSAVGTLNQGHSRELEVKKVDAIALGALYPVFICSNMGLFGKCSNSLAENQNMLCVNLRKWGTILTGVETKKSPMRNTLGIVSWRKGKCGVFLVLTPIRSSKAALKRCHSKRGSRRALY